MTKQTPKASTVPRGQNTTVETSIVPRGQNRQQKHQLCAEDKTDTKNINCSQRTKQTPETSTVPRGQNRHQKHQLFPWDKTDTRNINCSQRTKQTPETSTVHRGQIRTLDTSIAPTGHDKTGHWPTATGPLQTVMNLLWPAVIHVGLCSVSSLV